MISKEFEEAIILISKKLENEYIKWALIGSTNMAFQGMDVNPRDLDIVVQMNDLEKMKEIFSDYSASEFKELQPLSKLDSAKLELTFKIKNVLVQTIGERPEGLYVKKLLAGQIDIVNLKNNSIPCFDLKSEAQAYKETKRKHKADLITEFLNNKNRKH